MINKPYASALKVITGTVQERVFTSLGAVTIGSDNTVKYGFTVSENDLPKYDAPLVSIKYVGKLAVSGQNTNASLAVTVNYAMYKNQIYTTPVNSGSLSVAANKYFTADCSFNDVVVGDILEVSVWCSVTDGTVTVNNKMYFVAPTRVVPTTKPVIDYTELYNQYTALTNVVGSGLNGRILCGVTDVTFSTYGPYYYPVRHCVPSIEANAGYGIYRYGAGDYQSADVCTLRVTTPPSYFNYSHALYLYKVSYRELKE